ncbi:hypothetical protein R4Z10_20490 [Niallia sp. XMNu-256]|uniref:hypothetical protein n=1 Tax=Niallia sp. XMNu-256 TaxID=3082444 RepID=UPI0030CC5ED9
MSKPSASEVKRGQTISFRIPSDTPDHTLKQLQRLKETERRNFSSKIAEFALEGVNNAHSSERELITIPLPKGLTKAQRDWLKHEHSEALLGTILHHLISDPIRATSLLASLTSNSLNIDEALYLQEEEVPELLNSGSHEVAATMDPLESDSQNDPFDAGDMEDDLDGFDWEAIKQQQAEENVEDSAEEMDDDDLLGDFLAAMNK